MRMGMWHLSNLKNKSTNHQCVCVCGMTKKWPWSCFKLDPPAARESHRKAGSAAWPWTLDLGPWISVAIVIHGGQHDMDYYVLGCQVPQLLLEGQYCYILSLQFIR